MSHEKSFRKLDRENGRCLNMISISKNDSRKVSIYKITAFSKERIYIGMKKANAERL